MEKIIISIVILFILLMAMVLNSIYCSRMFEVISYNLSKDGKSGIKAVFITDLHGKSYGTENQKLLEAVRNQKPDLILIGGDMFVKEPIPDMSVAFAFVKELVEIAPVYYANGNHEKKVMDYWGESRPLFLQYKEELEQAGVKYLINAEDTITLKGRNIEIVGLDLGLREYRKFWHKQMLTEEELRTMVPARKSDTDTRILLAHNPKYFNLYAKLDVDLVLLGHVHGGIMILPFIGGVIAPDFHLFPKYDFGKFEEGNTTMILSKGLGVHSIPLRVMNKPELTVITL